MTTLRWPLSLLLGLSLVAPLHAAELTIGKLTTLIKDLGYEPAVDGPAVTLDNQGASKQTIKFTLSSDGTILNIYSAWGVDAAKRTALPAAAMLKANSNAAFAFATYDNDGNTFIDLEATYDTSLVTKKMLRHAIDQLVEVTDANEALWNQDKWTASASPAAPDTPEAARALYETLWDQAPMRAANAMLTTTDTDGYGAYTKRPNTSFKTGEKIFTYFEAQNFARKPVEDGKYAIGFTVDTTVTNAKGEIVFNKKDQAIEVAALRSKKSEFMFDMSFGFGEMPPGAYTLTYTVHDANSAKSMNVAMPFTIVAS